MLFLSSGADWTGQQLSDHVSAATFAFNVGTAAVAFEALPNERNGRALLTSGMGPGAAINQPQEDACNNR